MDIHFDLPKNRSNVIKVIGVGGGGSNAINHMFRQGIDGVDFVVCNTDSQALENSPVPTKVQLGMNLTEGLGAGANPEVGEQAALESFEDLKTLLDTNTKMVFITAGMGGGTGTGAAPVIAKQSRDLDILTVGIVTIPFKFEGKMRCKQAQKGVEKLRQNVDSLIVIDNDKLREVYGDLGFKSGFSKADEVLTTAARGIAEVITNHYTQNIDLRDAKTVLSHSGTAIMGSSQATGENRAHDAIVKAMDSPLLNDNKITGAQNVLLLIVSGSQEITLDEIGEINDHIQAEAGNSANIIMGVGEDEDLGEAVSVTIIATGFNKDQQNKISNIESKRIIHTLEEEQTSVLDLSPGHSQVRRQPEPQVEEIEEEPKLEPVPSQRRDSPQQPERIPSSRRQAAKRAERAGIIRTTEFLKDIEVNYKEVMYDEDDFVFVDTPEEDPFDPEFEEEDSSDLIFDFPLTEDTDEDTAPTDLGGDFDASHEEDGGLEARHDVNLYDHNDEVDTQRYDLDDYIEKEKELMEAQPKESEEPRLVSPQRSQTIERRRPSRGKVEEASTQKEEVEEEEKEVSPLNSSIVEGLAARASARRERLKKFNYKFRKNANIEEVEKQPAYKRAGVDLGATSGDKESGAWSRSSVRFDEDNQPHINRNNSYLHDNVD